MIFVILTVCLLLVGGGIKFYLIGKTAIGVGCMVAGVLLGAYTVLVYTKRERNKQNANQEACSIIPLDCSFLDAIPDALDCVPDADCGGCGDIGGCD